MAKQVQAEICADALRSNLELIRQRIPSNTEIYAAVKANAYGHGIEQVLPVLKSASVEGGAVAGLEEGLHLRRLGWTRPILCFSPILAFEEAKERRKIAFEAVAADLTCTVCSVEEVRFLANAAKRMGRPARVEINVDTGMGRVGLLPSQAEQIIADIVALPGVVIEGVYSHFANADEPDLAETHYQFECFLALLYRLKERNIPVRSFHAANSAAIFRFPQAHLDRVRPGLAIYGYWGGPEELRPAGLQPAMRVVTRLSAIRRLPPGHSIGYGSTFTTSRESLVGIVPVGYAEGYRRPLGNTAVMTLAAKPGRPSVQVPVIGRVSMDQVCLDLTEAGEVQAGDTVIVIDDDPAAANSVQNLSRELDTIPYEITTLIGTRVERIRRSRTKSTDLPSQISDEQFSREPGIKAEYIPRPSGHLSPLERVQSR